MTAEFVDLLLLVRGAGLQVPYGVLPCGNGLGKAVFFSFQGPDGPVFFGGACFKGGIRTAQGGNGFFQFGKAAGLAAAVGIESRQGFIQFGNGFFELGVPSL